MSEHKNLPFVERLRFAIAGIAHGLSSERSIKTQALILVLVTIAMTILRPAPLWWALVGLASCGVLAAELVNTAIETLADHLHPQVHPRIRIVKDCAAAAVLLMAVGAVIVAVALLVTSIHR